MSANAEVLLRSGIIAPAAKERGLTEIANGRERDSWNPEEFAQEQIRSLVQRVFFAGRSLSIRQVVFTPMGPETDVTGLCHQVGRGLSMETHSDIAIVELETLPTQGGARPRLGSAVKSWSVQIAGNLWRAPGFGRSNDDEQSRTGEYWLSCLTRLRNEFEYAVIQGPTAEISSELALLGQLSDGIVLVLDANSTRRVTARKLKEKLEATQARILGSVLSGRRFPMPYGIYRRL